MSYGESFISKVIDTGDVNAFDRYGITEEVLPSEAERQAMRFILDYADKNDGDVPDFRTVEAEVPNFMYIPQVTDSFKFMAEEIKDYAGKQRIEQLWYSEEIAKMFRDMKAEDFIDEVTKKMFAIQTLAQSGEGVGFDLKRDVMDILKEYERRKEGKSFKIYESIFPGINRSIGGYMSSNVYVWYGRSGRGKSVITMMEAIKSAMDGANVLIWSLEMARYELAARMIAAISALQGIFDLRVGDEKIDAGFNTKDILMGTLNEAFEEKFRDFLLSLNKIIKGRIIIRAIDEPMFRKRDVRALEADIKRFEADVVVVDPIYYMDMEKNTSNTAGGDVAKTSMKLRLMAGRLGVVMHVITQAEEVKDDEDEDGKRQLRVPKRAELKKAKQILEDSSNTFAIDTCDGRGMIAIGKGRNGGEDEKIEIIYLPSYGVVKEVGVDGAQDIFKGVGVF